MCPEIRNPSRLTLPPGVPSLLGAMFPDYQVVVLKDEFSSLGYSGSWVYRVHLLKGSDAPELPLVVKIAPPSLIAREVRAFQECVRNQWPGIAELRDQPVYRDEGDLGGLCYPLVGGGVFKMQSLREYCLEADTENVVFVLRERLFRIMKERMLRPARNAFEFSLRASYDGVLPVNLLVEPELTGQATPHPEGRQDVAPTYIAPDSLPHSPIQPGENVYLEGFVVTEVNPRQRSITLDVSPEWPSRAYRWRLRPVGDLAACPIGKAMPPVEGVVRETRQSRLQSELVGALGPKFDPTCVRVTAPDGQVLPNPLLAVPDLLSQSRHAKVSAIHGDLNLENVLVDPQVRDVRLIDFARARRDDVLHDFMRLETEVVTKVLPAALAEAQLPSEAICPFYRQLHCATFRPGRSGAHRPFHPALEKPFAILSALREASRDGLYCRDDVGEYYQGLVLYLLAALKFKDLGVVPKQVAFWGAATAVDLLHKPVLDAKTTQTRHLAVNVGITKSFSIRLALRMDILRRRAACSGSGLRLTCSAGGCSDGRGGGSGDGRRRETVVPSTKTLQPTLVEETASARHRDGSTSIGLPIGSLTKALDDGSMIFDTCSSPVISLLVVSVSTRARGRTSHRCGLPSLRGTLLLPDRQWALYGQLYGNRKVENGNTYPLPDLCQVHLDGKATDDAAASEYGAGLELPQEGAGFTRQKNSLITYRHSPQARRHPCRPDSGIEQRHIA